MSRKRTLIGTKVDLGKSFERAKILDCYAGENRVWVKSVFCEKDFVEPQMPGMLAVIGRVFRIEAAGSVPFSIIAANVLTGNRVLDENAMGYMNRAEFGADGELLSLQEIIFEREIDGRVTDLTNILFGEKVTEPGEHLSTLVEALFDDLASANWIVPYDPLCLEVESLSSFRARGR